MPTLRPSTVLDDPIENDLFRLLVHPLKYGLDPEEASLFNAWALLQTMLWKCTEPCAKCHQHLEAIRAEILRYQEQVDQHPTLKALVVRFVQIFVVCVNATHLPHEDT